MQITYYKRITKKTISKSTLLFPSFPQALSGSTTRRESSIFFGFPGFLLSCLPQAGAGMTDYEANSLVTKLWKIK